jgi:hypothetical protein
MILQAWFAERGSSKRIDAPRAQPEPAHPDAQPERGQGTSRRARHSRLNKYARDPNCSPATTAVQAVWPVARRPRGHRDDQRADATVQVRAGGWRLLVAEVA